MSARELHYRFVGCDPPQWCAEALRSLRSHKVAVIPATERDRGTAGLILVERIDEEVLSIVEGWSRGGRTRIIVVLGGSDPTARERAWSLLRSGASDVLLWEASEGWGSNIAERLDRWEEIDRIRESPLVRDNLVGDSCVWTAALRSVIEIARFTCASVLVLGESGTGKDLMARLIHTLDPRPNKKELVVLDCTTVVPQLSGSEFFGHERGAYTGATSGRDGAFALANGGTLFLDEVGDLPLTLQAELLRVVQEHRYKRLGSNTWKETDFRLICATNRNLEELEAQGAFRRDFYYRIAATTCRLPSLRERREDIAALARRFLVQLAGPRSAPGMDQTVESFLCDRSYRGNVRDLKQLVSRMFYRHVGSGQLTIGDIPEEEWPQCLAQQHSWRGEGLHSWIRLALDQGAILKQIGREAEREAVRMAMELEDGNLQRAARRLGVTDRALQMRRASERGDSGQDGPSEAPQVELN